MQFMPTSQRSLRVMRVELSDSGQRIVGIKFPVSEEAIARLMAGMDEVAKARQATSSDSTSFVDEPYAPIDEKARTFATTERKTMLSFFSAATSKSSGSSANGSGKRKSTHVTPKAASSGSDKKQKSNSMNKKKEASLTSFFGKKKSF